MTRNKTSTEPRGASGRPTGARAHRFALVVSRYHEGITDRLREGALAALAECGVQSDSVEIYAVPGTFELPFAARRVAESGEFVAVVCLGCLIRGETSHFDFIASAVAHGITAASSETGIPITFGVLTTNSHQEAQSRSSELNADSPLDAGASNKGNKGAEAAYAAVAMVKFSAISTGLSLPGSLDEE
jgi:6,7-dimethyl-8-ribityllumazine synthase